MADRRRRALITLVGAFVTLAAAAWTAGGSAAPKVHVRAKATWVKRGPEYRRVQVRITRDGRSWTSASLGTWYSARPSARVRDLDADGEPEVLLDTYTGGAHCCSVAYLFHYLPHSRRYGTTFHTFGNVGYRAKNVDGRDKVELLTKDDRSAYVFTAYAASLFPIQLWHVDGGRFVDVTRRFPALVESDAKGLLAEYERVRRERADVRGVLAAWLADQYLLGNEKAGWAKIDAAYRPGELGPRDDLIGWPQGRSYFKALRAFLVRTGYARA
jgi:hypothetical protein